MNWGWRGDCGCCNGTPPFECTIISDDFNRADNSDLGSDWTEVSGTWDISSNQLAATGAGYITTVAERASAATNYSVQATLPVGGRLLFDVDDSGNYQYIERNSVNYVRGTQSGPNGFFSAGTGNTIRLCVVGDRVIANYGASLGTVSSYTITPNDGLKAGLGAVSTCNIDDFNYSNLGDTCPTCAPNCSTECCDATTLEYIADLGVLGWVDDQCGHCDEEGGEYSLYNAGPCQWEYRQDYDDCCNPGSAIVFRVVLNLISGCKWRVVFGFRIIENPDLIEGCTEFYGTYESSSAISDSTTCDDGTEFTLDYVSNVSGDMCSGTFPSTITIRSVP